MATSITPYLHVLEGRLRIKIPAVKGAPQRAHEVEQLLLSMHGSTDVTANPTTGNVLVLFDSHVIDQHTIIAALQQSGYLRGSHKSSGQQRQSLTHFVVQSAIELALERMLLALM